MEPIITVRMAVAMVQLAFIQLLETAGFSEIPLTDLAVNLDGRSLRIDVARLDQDGHISEHLAGYSIDPRDLPRFGMPIGLPRTEGQIH